MNDRHVKPDPPPGGEPSGSGSGRLPEAVETLEEASVLPDPVVVANDRVLQT